MTKAGSIARWIIVAAASCQCVACSAPRSSSSAAVRTNATSAATGAAAPEAAHPAELTDAQFIDQAASAGLWEVRSSELALERLPANSPEAEFARRVIKDATTVNADLEQMARQLGHPVSTVLLPAQQQMLEELEGMSGDAFAQRYAQGQLQVHKDGIELFRRAAQSSDPQLRQFAERTLPPLEAHLAHATSLLPPAAAGVSTERMPVGR